MIKLLKILFVFDWGGETVYNCEEVGQKDVSRTGTWGGENAHKQESIIIPFKKKKTLEYTW